MQTFALLSTGGIDGHDLTVVATSITLVFCMLAALCLIITLEGKIFDAMRAKKQAPAAKPAAPAAQPAAPAAPKAQGGIPGEIVAAIAAAVAYITGGTGTVRSIRKSGAKANRRGAWGQAGADETTRPFM